MLVVVVFEWENNSCSLKRYSHWMYSVPDPYKWSRVKHTYFAFNAANFKISKARYSSLILSFFYLGSGWGYEVTDFAILWIFYSYNALYDVPIPLCAL